MWRGLLALLLFAGFSEALKQCNSTGMPLVLVLDTRMGEGLTDDQQRAIRDYYIDMAYWIKDGTGTTKLGIVSASSVAKVESGIGECSDIGCIVNSIEKMPFEKSRGRSNFADAMNLAITQLKGVNYILPKTIVVITDRIPNNVNRRLKSVLDMMEKDRTLNINTFLLAASKRVDCSHPFAVGMTGSGSCFIKKTFKEIKKNQVTKDICDFAHRGRVFVKPTIPYNAVCHNKADIVLMIDRSGSIVGDNRQNYKHWIEVRQFLSELVTRFGVGPNKTHVAIISFANPERTILHVNLGECNDVACLQEVIWNLDPPNGKTDLYGAFMLADRLVFNGKGGDRHDAVDIVIAMTDGKPVPNNPNLLTLVDNMKINKNANVLTVGVTEHVDKGLMEFMASHPASQNAFQVKHFDELLHEIEGIQTSTCNRAAAPKPLEQIECNADIALVVDRSGSITEKPPHLENWADVKKFLAGLIDSLKIGLSHTRVGLVDFGDDVTIQKHLRECNDAQCLKAAIEQIQNPGGSTVTDQALDTVERQMFVEAQGDRPGVRNKVVMLTDGKPNPYYPDRIADIVRRLRARDIEVFVIGVTKEVDLNITETIVSAPMNQHYYPVDYFNSLANPALAYGIITQACRPDPVTTPAPTAAPPPPDPLRDCVKDVVIIMDRSSTIIENPPYLNSWDAMKAMVSSYISKLNVGPSRTRVALVSFSDQAKLEFDLSVCGTVECMVRHVYAVNAPGGLSNFTAAFMLTMRSVLNGRPGDRNFAPDVITVVTDGRPFPHDPNLLQWIENNVKSRNVKIQAVGVTSRVNNAWMRELVNSPSQYNYFGVPTYNDLSKVVPGLVEETCRVDPRPTVRPIICDVDMLLIVDNSGSIIDPPRGELNMDDLRTFLLRLLDNIEVGQDKTRVAFMWFANNAHVILNLDTCRDRDCVKRAVWGLGTPFGTTNTSGALDAALLKVFLPELGDRATHRNAIVLVTDGRPNPPNEAKLRASVDRLRLNDIAVFGIGVTDNIDVATLQKMVSEPADKFFYQVHSFLALTANYLYRTVLQQACTNVPRVTDPPPPPTLAPPRACQADILILLSRSSSIGHSAPNFQNWNLLKNFVISLIGGLQIGPGQTRVALIDYADIASVNFFFDGCSDAACMINHVRALSIPFGKSDMGTALSLAKERVFPQARGNARKIVIILDDSKPDPYRGSITESARALKDSGVKVIAIGLGDMADEELMLTLASEPKNQHHYSVRYSGLNEQFKQRVLSQACTGPIGPPATLAPPFNLIDACEAGVDLILLVDDSIFMEDFNGVKEWLIDIVKKMEVKTVQIGIAVFGHDVRYVTHLGSDIETDALMNKIRNLAQQRSQTVNIPAALNYTYSTMLTPQFGDRPEKDNVVVLVTAGHSVNRDDSFREAEKLHEKAKIITVGLGNRYDPLELRGIATHPADENFRRVTNVKLLPSDSLLPDLCAGAAMTCDTVVDLCFILTTSSAMDPSQYQAVIRFVTNVVSAFTVDKDKARVSVITVGNGVKVRFNLDTHQHNSQVVSSLRGIQFEGGDSKDIGEAFRKATYDVMMRKSDMFKERYVILIHSGSSSNNYGRTKQEAESLKMMGVKLIEIIIMPGPGRHELENTVNKQIMVKDYSSLSSHTAELQDEICQAM